jgi:predicted RNA polymerase sigma factor
MGQRISRAKSSVKASGSTFALPSPDQHEARLRSVLHVLYLLFNEGYAASGGSDLARPDLSTEAIRLTRGVRGALPEDPEVESLLALMVLTDARRPARIGDEGELVPLPDQDRSLWDQRAIAEGIVLVTAAMRRGRLGEYQVQAAIAALHDQAARYADTDWVRILALYDLLDRMTDNPMVSLNRAVAVAMVRGPHVGLSTLSELGPRLGGHHRLRSVRAHLLELAGETDAAVAEFHSAAEGTTNARERDYLAAKAASLSGRPR